MGPAKVMESKKEKRRHRSREGSSRKHRDERSSPRRDRNRDDERSSGRHRDGREEHKSRSIRQRANNDEEFEDRWGDQDEEDEESEFQESASKRVKTSHSDDDISEGEKERRRDQAEKDAFAKRLLEKDKNKSNKNIVEDSTTKEGSIMAQRRALANDSAARAAAMPDIREKSRQDYLRKREQERIALLRKQVSEETMEVQSGVRLSQKELMEFAKNREVLRLAEERNRIDDHLEGYQLPSDYFAKDKGELLNKRHVERDEYGNEKMPLTELEEWERSQSSMAKAQIGSQRVDEDEQYSYVMDEEQGIKWIMDSKVPGTGTDSEFLDKLEKAEAKALSMEETRKSLPVYKYRDEFIAAVKEHQTLVLLGDTGSGKTTQLPQYLHEEGFSTRGKIACTQPRRVAAMSVAKRVSEEMGTKCGDEVGYSIRFEDNTSDKTLIQYMTDGFLLRLLMTDPSLEAFSVVILDEAHERTVHTDILMALLKDLCRVREDLRIVIASATLSAQKFSDYFEKAPMFKVEGRTYPIEIFYTPQPEANYLAAAITTIFQIHTSQPLGGDILLFLTGQDEIEAAEEKLTEISTKLGSRIPELQICAVFANLPSELQSKIFDKTPPQCRKVVLATNIAETSLTIPDIHYVIDPGFVKENSFNPATGMSKLVTVPCSRASANQRSGRAGRVAPGKCFRLYTSYAYQTEMDDSTTPEIQRTNLNGIVLQLMSMGIRDLLSFDFMDPPPTETLSGALQQLYALGALNHRGELTKIGRQIAEFPTEPSIAKSVIYSDKLGCSDEVITLCAMLPESGALWIRPKKDRVHADSARARFTIPEAGDFSTLLNVFNSWADSDYSPIFCKENFLQQRSLTRARDVRDQLAKLCERVEVTLSSCGITNLEPIQKAMTAGFFQNAARLQRGGDSYRSWKSNNTVYIHPSSVLMGESMPPKNLIYFELVETSKEYMRNCMPIKPAWLREVAPHFFSAKDMEGSEDKKVPKDRNRM